MGKLNQILFHSHLGLGDQISVNGLVHHLYHLHNKPINVVCKIKNFSNIDFLYKDFDYINPIAISNDPSLEQKEVNNLTSVYGYELIQTTISNPLDNPWDKSHFTNLGVDINVKLWNCNLPLLTHEEFILENYLPDEDFAFVHDHPSHPIKLKHIQTLNNPQGLNIFELLPLLQRAKEIHLTNSSIMCLCEIAGLPSNQQKGFYYTSRSIQEYGGILQLSNHKDWNII